MVNMTEGAIGGRVINGVPMRPAWAFAKEAGLTEEAVGNMLNCRGLLALLHDGEFWYPSAQIAVFTDLPVFMRYLSLIHHMARVYDSPAILLDYLFNPERGLILGGEFKTMFAHFLDGADEFVYETFRTFVEAL